MEYASTDADTMSCGAMESGSTDFTMTSYGATASMRPFLASMRGARDSLSTTGFRRFAGCRKHPAKATLHSAKPLPGAALGKEPPAKS
jgi:hypothetical protein